MPNYAAHRSKFSNIVINFLRLPEPNQNMLHLFHYHILQQCAKNLKKFRENGQIPWPSSKFPAFRGKLWIAKFLRLNCIWQFSKEYRH